MPDAVPASLPPKITSCCAPCGWVATLPILFSLAGLMMVAVAGFGCEMFVLEQNEFVVLTFGYAGVEFLGGCVPHASPVSPHLRAGYASAVLATLLGVATLTAAVLAAVVRFPVRAVRAMSVPSFGVAAIGGAAVCGVAFAVEECRAPGITCKAGSKTYLAMAGALFWVAAGISFWFVPGREHLEEEEEEEYEEEEEDKNDDDDDDDEAGDEAGGTGTGGAKGDTTILVSHDLGGAARVAGAAHHRASSGRRGATMPRDADDDLT